MPLKIIFCGTPSFAVPALKHLIAEPDFRLLGVVTQPDRPRGRGGAISFSPVKEAAAEAGIPVYQPAKIKTPEAMNYFRELAPDVVVIIAYGQIISAALIEIPRFGWINLHGSLLPKYRGAAPIHWAIANGEKITGVTTMQIDAGLDTGPMLLKYETAIGPDETSPQLMSRLAQAGAPLIAETLRKLDAGELIAQAQDDAEATFAPILKKADGRIQWSQSAQTIYNRMRAFQPWPGAFSMFRDKNCQLWGKPAVNLSGAIEGTAPGSIFSYDKLIGVACGEQSALQLEFVQMEGRKRVTAQEFANGARLTPGEYFV